MISGRTSPSKRHTREQSSGDASHRSEQSLREAYAGGKPVPLQQYAVIIGIYSAAFAGMTTLAARKDKLPRRVHWGDIALLGLATHKLSRVITKDWVTSPIRAPFTEYKESAGSGEIKEKSRGRGAQRAAGDLLTCPFCTGGWIAAAFGFGLVLAPRLTRMVGTVFAIEAVSDFLHIAHNATQKVMK